MDIQMHNMDGDEATELNLKNWESKRPVIDAMTAKLNKST